MREAVEQLDEQRVAQLAGKRDFALHGAPLHGLAPGAQLHALERHRLGRGGVKALVDHRGPSAIELRQGRRGVSGVSIAVDGSGASLRLPPPASSSEHASSCPTSFSTT